VTVFRLDPASGATVRSVSLSSPDDPHADVIPADLGVIRLPPDGRPGFTAYRPGVKGSVVMVGWDTGEVRPLPAPREAVGGPFVG